MQPTSSPRRKNDENACAACLGACGMCLGLLTIFCYLAGAVVTLYYSAKAWHDEGGVTSLTPPCNDAVNWNKFIAIWMGLICYSLFVLKEKASNNADFKDLVGAVVAYWLFGVGFGFGTYDKYYATCDNPDLTQTTHAVMVFMYFWLALAGSITLGSVIFVAATAMEKRHASSDPTAAPPAHAPARMVMDNGDTNLNNRV